MLSACERQLLFFYLSNAASHLHNTSRLAFELAEWVDENRDLLGLKENTGNPAMHPRDSYRTKELSPREWRCLLEIIDQGKPVSGEEPAKDHTAQRLRSLGREMELAPEDIAILEVLLRYCTNPVVRSLVDCICDQSRRSFAKGFNLTNPIIAEILGLSAGAFRACLAPDAPLVKSGLLSVEEDGDFEVIRRLYRFVSVQNDSDLDVCGLLLDPAIPGELEWSDFDHISEDRDHIEKVLRGALHTRTQGVNVLVYGPPGTGKTEFCKTLASRLEATLYCVGEVDNYGDEPKRHERLQELRLSQRLLAPGRGAILLFNEMEDLLSDPGSGWIPLSRPGFPYLRSGGSKVFMNRLLERAPVPTLWTSNSARETCPTILRRMTFALELRQPTPRVRARIWRRELARHGIEATEENTRSLARISRSPPGWPPGPSPPRSYAEAISKRCVGACAASRG